MATFLGLILSVLKLLGTLSQLAEDTRRQGEADAVALKRVLDDATDTVSKARAAREHADAAARAGAVHDDDGHRRD